MAITQALPPTVKRAARTARGYAKHLAHSLMDRRPKVVVLLYHRVLPEVGWNPLNTKVSVRTFQRQMERIAKTYAIMSLGDAASRSPSVRGSSRMPAVLTFDDGYRDNYEVAFPILRRLGLPATFFLVTDYLDGARPLWDWDIMLRLRKNSHLERVELAGEMLLRRRTESQFSFALRVLEEMKSAGRHATQAALDGLANQFEGMGAGVRDSALDRCMTWEEAGVMARQGMELGAHTRSHRSLSRIPFAEADQEIRESKAAIERRTGTPCAHFAFPFGSQRDFNEGLVETVREAGFRTCLLNIHGYNHASETAFCFKRIIMHEATDVRSLLG